MPANIVHMLISRRVREELELDETIDSDFVAALKLFPQAMELGSLGPDLPYYESMLNGAMALLFQRSDKPMGVDQWSYQLHSKDPNLFPLKLIEITWKETIITKEEWEEDDLEKLAFACGFLTHIAARSCTPSSTPLRGLITREEMPGKSTGSARSIRTYMPIGKYTVRLRPTSRGKASMSGVTLRLAG